MLLGVYRILIVLPSACHVGCSRVKTDLTLIAWIRIMLYYKFTAAVYSRFLPFILPDTNLLRCNYCKVVTMTYHSDIEKPYTQLPLGILFIIYTISNIRVFPLHFRLYFYHHTYFPFKIPNYSSRYIFSFFFFLSL